MSRTTKPYRRFRSRGRDGAEGDGLAELRSLTDRESGDRAARTGPGRRPDGEAPPPPRRPGRLEREQRRALRREGRRWWSLRGLGPGGWAWRTVLVLFVAVVAWAGFGYLALNGAVGEANDGITASARAALDAAPGGMLGTPQNTLVLGVDKRKGARARADTVLIMRTDPDAGRIKYLSIPRDWRIELPGQGTQKINAAFLFYGQAGMIRAVKRLTGLPIHHVMVVKLNRFAEMVDALGGVTVTNATAIENCYYEAGRTVSFPAGRIDLNGTEALEFSRVRKCDDDFRRAQRQQAVVAGMKNKVVSVGGLWRAPWRGADLVRNLQTDIGTMDMIKMGWLQSRLEQRTDDRTILTGDPQTIGNTSFVVQTNPDLNEQEIARFVSSG